MANENTVWHVKNEINEVQREIDVTSELLDLGYGVEVGDDVKVPIRASDLKKIQLRLYDLLFVLRNSQVTLPFPCRNGK